ncbi:hypothetical protein [Pseudomonas sp. B14(2017)]|uniref:hypothetical protein n=1 Tax=Pseudomonas sp. B14(2017) TaxID=1981745 RepID=UPI000A1DBA4A|nr:hypothetical protein [Pseudomonas sp. B14(2017)]
MSQLETLPAKPDRFTVAKLIEQQIDQVYDRFRMRQAWERVVANIDPAEMAGGCVWPFRTAVSRANR